MKNDNWLSTFHGSRPFTRLHLDLRQPQALSLDRSLLLGMKKQPNADDWNNTSHDIDYVNYTCHIAVLHSFCEQCRFLHKIDLGNGLERGETWKIDIYNIAKRHFETLKFSCYKASPLWNLVNGALYISPSRYNPAPSVDTQYSGSLRNRELDARKVGVRVEGRLHICWQIRVDFQWMSWRHWGERGFIVNGVPFSVIAQNMMGGVAINQHLFHIMTRYVTGSI